MARILVVDDYQSIREMFSEQFTLDGHEVVTAEDGFEAFKKVAENDSAFDLIFTDFRMPRCNGLGLLMAVRSRGSRVPVVLCSWLEQDETARLKGVGFADFLRKDESIGTISATVAKLLQERIA